MLATAVLQLKNLLDILKEQFLDLNVFIYIHVSYIHICMTEIFIQRLNKKKSYFLPFKDNRLHYHLKVIFFM